MEYCGEGLVVAAAALVGVAMLSIFLGKNK
jgi:hypothetical protein